MEKIECIEWYDACATKYDSDMSKAVNELQSGKELLAVNKTYGVVKKLLQDVLILITEESTADDTEVTLIPRGWIISPKKYGKKYKRNKS
jgi:hypothetical protein